MSRSGLSKDTLEGIAGAIRTGEAHQDAQIKLIEDQKKEIERLREWVKEPRAWAESDKQRTSFTGTAMLNERIKQCDAMLKPEGGDEI